MKKYILFLTVGALLCAFGFNPTSAFGNKPLSFDVSYFNNNQPLSELSQPPLSSIFLKPEFSLSIRTAAVNWLPDWQWEGRSSSADAGSNNTTSLTCEKYGLQTALPNGSLYNYDIKQNVAVKDDGTGLTCYGNIRCKATFQYNSSNCSGNYTPGGLSCGGKYLSCSCKADFKYNAANCSGQYQPGGTACNGNYNACIARPCSDGGYSSTRNNDVCTNVTYGGRTCYSCRAFTCAEKCSGYSTGTTCLKGQTKETCSGCGEYARCTGNACPNGVGSCANGCKTYSNQSGCSDICLECKPNPCAGYYDCGGSWQYCTGSKCSADSSKCSVYCVNDYFPNSCSDSSACKGVYRNGYCSGSCEVGCSPEVGKILYSDNSCSFDLISGKTPIGVIADANKRIALAITASARMPWGGSQTAYTGNSELISCVTGYDSFRPVTQDGAVLSTAILQAQRQDGLSYPAVEFCRDYSTAGTSRGDWYLPSLSELYYALHQNAATERKKIENAVAKLNSFNYFQDHLWTSSQGQGSPCCVCRMEYGKNYYWQKFDEPTSVALCATKF